jgi:hypothetical protein
MGMEGEGSEEELANFLENMMGQLLSKEVLYDPLKELADKVRSTTYEKSLLTQAWQVVPWLSGVSTLPTRAT